MTDVQEKVILDVVRGILNNPDLFQKEKLRVIVLAGKMISGMARASQKLEDQMWELKGIEVEDS